MIALRSFPTFATVLILVAACIGSDDPAGAKQDDASARRRDQAALEPLAGLVGPWKGTGQPQRGRAQGSWVETGEWTWTLTAKSAALKLDVAKGKYLRKAILQPLTKEGAFAIEATLADGSERRFRGELTKSAGVKAVFTADESSGDGVRRITLTPLHDTRFLMLLEGRLDADARFTRLAEVGYTRVGVAFAAADSAPVCIVTGGRGTTQVTYEGKTYWVCCSGCKDLFNEDPKAVLAEAAERAKTKTKPAGK
ncbi:MAG: hypothetical protein SFX72_06275 [Isosphaeraceae bacterium]|nr:hypothetical protein [Isosphaeraceae bacterium]